MVVTISFLHLFRLFLQWSENYFCGEVEMEELWECAVVAANRLLKGEGEDALEVRHHVYYIIYLYSDLVWLIT